MPEQGGEEQLLRSVALQNASSILLARQRAEEEAVRAKEALERKTAELAQSLALTRATLESTTDGILVTDGVGKVTAFNQKYLDMWQVRRATVEALRDHRQLAVEVAAQRFRAPAKYLARIEELYATAPPESYDLLEMLDGRVFERFSRIQWVEDRNVGRVWSFRDITERRRAEQALREETRVLELLNAAGMVIGSTLDLQTLVQAVTDAATQLSGAKFGSFFYNVHDESGDAYQLYTLSGAPREAFEKFGHPRATELFAPTFRGEGAIRIDDVLKDPRYGKMGPHHGMPAGHLPVRSYLAVPVISRSGDVIGGLFFAHPEVGVFTERAERMVSGIANQAAMAIDNARLYEDVKRAGAEREALLEAERAARAEAERVNVVKDEFLATVSHELRTPLNAILGWSQILATGRLGGEEMKQGLETITRNARSQAQIIEDLLDMSRIISGRLRLDIQRTDLVGIVEAAIESVRPSAEAKEISLVRRIDPQGVTVSGDPNRLQQVVWNLLSNAIKFTPREGRVEMTLARVASQVEITVSDSGIGIDPAFLPHLFERFRQADSSTTRKYGGLGLGLSIVKQLVELHGGSVRAESEGEQRGATFVVSLPVAAVRSDEGNEDARDVAGGGPCADDAGVAESSELRLDGVTVLVVDDEQDARELIRRVLARCKAEVIVAASAAEGMERLAQRRPDVIVSDIGMTGKDGYQFIRDVRQLDEARGGKTPAVALTAFARSEDRTRAMMAGYQMHLAKPIEPRELVATVGSLAGRTGKA